MDSSRIVSVMSTDVEKDFVFSLFVMHNALWTTCLWCERKGWYGEKHDTSCLFKNRIDAVSMKCFLLVIICPDGYFKTGNVLLFLFNY